MWRTAGVYMNCFQIMFVINNITNVYKSKEQTTEKKKNQFQYSTSFETRIINNIVRNGPSTDYGHEHELKIYFTIEMNSFMSIKFTWFFFLLRLWLWLQLRLRNEECQNVIFITMFQTSNFWLKAVKIFICFAYENIRLKLNSKTRITCRNQTAKKYTKMI